MISYTAGRQFELIFLKSGARQGIGILRIPDGCKRVGKSLVPVKTPCDFILLMDGKCALIDTKTQGSGHTFPRANINLNQVSEMNSMVHYGALGGYVCWFRDINKVVFYNCEILSNTSEGLHSDRGVYLGPIESMDLRMLMSGNYKS